MKILLPEVNQGWVLRMHPLLRLLSATSRRSKLLLCLPTQAKPLSPTVSPPNHTLYNKARCPSPKKQMETIISMIDKRPFMCQKMSGNATTPKVGYGEN